MRTCMYQPVQTSSCPARSIACAPRATTVIVGRCTEQHGRNLSSQTLHAAQAQGIQAPAPESAMGAGQPSMTIQWRRSLPQYLSPREELLGGRVGVDVLAAGQLSMQLRARERPTACRQGHAGNAHTPQTICASTHTCAVRLSQSQSLATVTCRTLSTAAKQRAPAADRHNQAIGTVHDHSRQLRPLDHLQ